MEHRGATSADNISGDGAGILTSIPWKLFKDYVDPSSSKNYDGTTACAVSMMFLPKDRDLREKSVNLLHQVVEKYDFEILRSRDVPIDVSVLGALSRDFVPDIVQFFFRSKGSTVSATEAVFENRLYEMRREIMGNFRAMKSPDSYISSLSSKTIVYKGMLRSCDLSLFYKDLLNPLYESAFAVYHRRFSTNTVPKWYLAQPMRLLAHNGEINTLLGNINWVKSRQQASSEAVKSKRAYGPLVDVARSDSANLDSIFENYVRSGRSPQEALMILVPEAYKQNPMMSHKPDLKAFYEYYETVQEAWDGPALLVFSDGNCIGAALDRNGLRPARFMITENEAMHRTVHVMSEVGVTKILSQFADQGALSTGEKLLDSGRLGPGEMLSVDLKAGVFMRNEQVKQAVAALRPYKQWLDDHVTTLPKSGFGLEIQQFVENHISDPAMRQSALSIDSLDTAPIALEIDNKNLIETQTYFGWGTEDVEVQITAMASEGIEATFCMGDDAPLAALSEMPHTLYDYFKQRFAQVTNPPIDPLREGAVMSLTMYLGIRGDPTSKDGQPFGQRNVKIESPVMTRQELADLSGVAGMTVHTLSTLYPTTQALTQGGLVETLDALCDQAVAAVRAGATVINLSDLHTDTLESDYDKFTYIPPLLAVGAVHHRLIEQGLRTLASIIVTSGQVWSTHHFACLIGYGASAVIPYLAYDAVINWHGQKRNQLAMQRGDIKPVSVEKALLNYKKSVDKGLLKILSKMGISLLTSYHGAQIFEAIGLNDNVILHAFKGTPSRINGLTFDEIAAENLEFLRKAYGDGALVNMVEKVEAASVEGGEEKAKKLFNYGFLNFLKSGEYHHNNQPLIKTLHSAIRAHKPNLYKLYEEAVTSRPPTTLRDLLQFVPISKSERDPVEIEEVESVESIMTRFCSGAMSLGALSREAHETLAISMNRIGGKSNSGEGGEDPRRFKPIEDVDDMTGMSESYPYLKDLRNGDLATSKIKQVASGRFGVTPEYLMSGSQLEIKVAQGAKPGEGGQLPGAKIDEYIARLRKSKPGVTLISPPPHHDIYSIEDLAQLIHDLHQINPTAAVSVKLVSEVGIGTVASGVAKAGADVIQISGHDGGTGASPVSSIKHAGSPWELGLIESHSTLLRNGLRERVLLRVDGGLKSGWDVIMAAAMGAEEFGFGTIAMIAEGCIMARICHTNKCPVGITTQNEDLRKRFPGTPDNVVTFFGYVAQEVREILATLGYRSLKELIGKPGVLEMRENLKLKKTSSVELSYMFSNMYCMPNKSENFCAPEDDRSWLEHGPVHTNGHTLDDTILEDAEIKSAISHQKAITKRYQIANVDRSTFARVSGVLAAKYGDGGFNGILNFQLTGAAGQSFCAFLSHGMHVHLNGFANDYVCKGMAGGRVVISPFLSAELSHKEALSSYSVAGNTVLYGATGGELFVHGRVGERFAVRNSGALGLAEGLGDHGCEYMTAGTIVCLGRTGSNFGAGMTGGLAFVVDDDAWLDDKPSDSQVGNIPFEKLVNTETIVIKKLTAEYGNAVNFLRDKLEAHVGYCQSQRAQRLLNNLDDALMTNKISLVVPNSEKNNPLLVMSEKVAPVEQMSF